MVSHVTHASRLSRTTPSDWQSYYHR
jgi:hypothetical protein